jgi:ATP-dependent Clp protease protease subunit
MKTAARKNTDLSIFLENGIDLENRRIHLIGEIDEQSSGMVIKGLQLMAAKDPDKEIDLYINSPGGDLYSSVGIYDYIRFISTPVRTYNIGACMSGATIVFLAGTERYSFENSVFMFHTVASAIEGKAQDIITDAKECQKIISQMTTIYAHHSTLSTREWAKLIKSDDVYIRAKEALKLKIVTAIIPSLKD